MKFTSLYINGFGRFHDLKIEGLSPGVTLFLGMNESGKSTLLGFLRALLFGFPDGRSNENLYPPLAGGQHGGNLTLVTDNEALYVVERSPGPRGGKVDILKPDQTHTGKEFLGRLLGISSKQLFKNIYAFSLSELQTFESLNTESVNDIFYSAGAGIDSAGLAKLRTELEKREKDLFKPGGSKPRINVILSRLMAISKEKKALFGSVEEYDRKKALISALHQEIQRLEQQRRDISRQLTRTEQWITIWPEWIGLSLAEQKLEHMEPIDRFPSQGLHRFEALKSRAEDLQAQYMERDEDLRRHESKLSSLTTDADLLNQGAHIRQLQRDQGHFDVVLQDLPSERQKLSLGEQRLEENLRHLGPDWTEEKVLAFDLSIATREEVRHHRGLLERIKLETHSKKESLEHLTAGKSEAEEVIRNLKEPSEKDQEHLAKLRRSCGELRGLESDNRLLKEELRNIDERIDDLKQENRALEENLGQGDHVIPLWLIFVIMGLGGFFLAWAAFNKALGGSLQAGGLLLFLSLLLWFLNSQIKGKDSQRDQSVRNRLSYLSTKLSDLETKKSQVNDDVQDIEERMTEVCTMLSLSEIPSQAHIDQLEENLEKLANELQFWLKAFEEVQQAEDHFNKAHRELQHVESEARKIQDHFQEWLESRGLNPILSPDGALETLSAMESFREQAGILTAHRARIESLEEEKKTFLSLANQILRACHRPETGEEDVQTVVRSLIEELNGMEKAAQEKDLTTKAMKEVIESKARIQEQAQKLRQEIKELMTSGGTDDEEQFRTRADIYEKRMALKTQIDDHTTRINRLSSKLDVTYNVTQELKNLTLEELEDKQDTLAQRLKEAEAHLDRQKEERATLEEQARRLANDDRISFLRAEEEGLKQELSSLAMEWSTARLSQGLIRMAWTKYQKEKQPDVIRESGRFFERMTGGAYPSLVAPIGENRIDVMCEDNSQKGVEVLSRGTAEQLYLSLRFGFIREFSKASDPLPIIMDDILVNFDPQRLKATAHAILELSQEHQILFFTCHPQMATLFRGLDPHITILEMADQGVKRWKQADA